MTATSICKPSAFGLWPNLLALRLTYLLAPN
nr:MAG TPA: conotoxin [Caudoviricetes sp.]